MVEKLLPPEQLTIRQVFPKGKMATLDLGVPLHRDYLASLYDGIDIPSIFPAFHALHRNTLAAHGSRAKQDAGIYHDKKTTPCLQDGIDIEYVAYRPDEKTMAISAAASTVKKALFIDEFLEVYTPGGRILCKRKSSTPNTGSVNTVEAFDFDITSFSDDRIEIIYTAVWAENDLQQLKSMVYPLSCTLASYLTPCIESVNLVFPKKINTEPGGPIVVCYGRVPSSAEVVDKTYDLIYRDWKPTLLLDFIGDVVFEEPDENMFGRIDITSFELKVNTNAGYAIYRPSYICDGKLVNRTQQIIDSFTRTEKGFSFALDNDWKDIIPTLKIPARDTVKLTFRVEFHLTNGRKSVLQIASCAEGSNIVPIPTLNLLWGCLAKGSLITMADGTHKPIEAIREGERVRANFLDVSATVVCCWRGQEDRPLICIQCDNGRELVCTQEHPVITASGLLRAFEITRDHMLLEQSGAPVAIHSITETAGGEVFNLTLRLDDPASAFYWQGKTIGGATMYCNGLLVGDSTLQNKMALACDTADFNIVHTQESVRRQKLFEADEL